MLCQLSTKGVCSNGWTRLRFVFQSDSFISSSFKVTWFKSPCCVYDAECCVSWALRVCAVTAELDCDLCFKVTFISCSNKDTSFETSCCVYDGECCVSWTLRVLAVTAEMYWWMSRFVVQWCTNLARRKLKDLHHHVRPEISTQSHPDMTSVVDWAFKANYLYFNPKVAIA